MKRNIHLIVAIFAALIAICTLCLLVYAHYKYVKKKNLPSFTFAVESTNLESIVKNEVLVKPVASLIIDYKDGLQYGEKDFSEVKAWVLSNGIFTQEDLADYRGYTEAQLKNLADSGDLKAMNILVGMLLARSNIGEAGSYLEKSIVYGSLDAIQLKSNFLAVQTEGSKDGLLMSLALFRTLALRGDWLRSKNAIDVFNSTYEKIHGEPVALNDDDRKKIYSIADLLLNHWNDERSQLGLPPFNNAISPAIERYMEAMSGGNKSNSLML